MKLDEFFLTQLGRRSKVLAWRWDAKALLKKNSAHFTEKMLNFTENKMTQQRRSEIRHACRTHRGDTAEEHKMTKDEKMKMVLASTRDKHLVV